MTMIGAIACRYESARKALAEARAIDEVKTVRDQAVAMAAYARQAKNRDMEADAVEIRLRATRRLDQLRQAQKETVGLAVGGEHGGRLRIDGVRKTPSIIRPTLAMQGIDKNLAKQARVLGALSMENSSEPSSMRVMRSPAPLKLSSTLPPLSKSAKAIPGASRLAQPWPIWKRSHNRGKSLA
jgi:hypothetical protein